MTQPPHEPFPPGPELPTPQAPARYPVPASYAYATDGPDPRYLPRPTKTMAGWALALAIVPCFGITPFVAIGLAITVLVRSRDGQDHGKGLAIASLIIAPLWIVVIVVSAFAGAFQDVTRDAERDSAGEVVGRDQMSTLKIREGDCFDYPELADGGAADTVAAMPCGASHEFEAYYEFLLPDGPYPGEKEVSVTAARRCLKEFRGFVGLPYGQSMLEPYNLYPTAETWRLVDDHKVTCIVTNPGYQTTGTLRDLRR